MNNQFEMFCDYVNRAVGFPPDDFLGYKEIFRQAMDYAGYSLARPTLVSSPEAPSLPKRSKKRDPNVPAKLNGYTLFSKDLAARRKKEKEEWNILSNEQKEECKAKGKEFVIGNHFTILSTAWKQLSEEEKETWSKNADEINKRNGYIAKPRTAKKPTKPQPINELSDDLPSDN